MIYILKFGAAWILPPGIFVAREANKSAAILLTREALIYSIYKSEKGKYAFTANI